MIAAWAELPPSATAETCDVVIPGSELPPPAITYLVRTRLWRLERDYVFNGGPWHIHLSSGFLFDLASIPRAAWKLCAPFELSIAAPLIHDVLYRYGGRCREYALIHPWREFTRAEADQLFRRTMQAEGVPWWRSGPAYAAVRAFGSPSWRSV